MLQHSSRVVVNVSTLAVAPVPTRAETSNIPMIPARPDKRSLAEQVIEERLGSAMLTVANLCRWTGMSRSSLYRLFDADGGVQAYIRDQRLARVAAELRLVTTGRVADIAERWGFCDAAYLARVFREVHGMTPSAYRASHAG